MTTGDCYQAAAQFVMDNEGWTLVHGHVTGQGRIAGVRYEHAWAERTTGGQSWVMDPSNGRTLRISRELYYVVGEIEFKELKRYTQQQVREHLLLAEHWGPWFSDSHETF